MAYLCTRCEADEHPQYDKAQMSQLAADVLDDVPRKVFAHVTYCEGCSSNTVHVSDKGERFGE